VREIWRERFAGSEDVLIGAERQQTVVPILDIEIGGDAFVTMAGLCSVETEFQLMATAHHVRRAGARILRGDAFKQEMEQPGSAGLRLMQVVR
jgi:3-deoxy-7-phosphoheptulonate synthase